MRINFFKLFLLITVLSVSSGDLIAQVNWTKYPGNPVIPGQPGTWYAYVSMNSVLYNADSSRYEMWFTAGAQISFPYTIGFATSVDGISWNVYASNPVLTTTAGSWDAYTVLAPHVIRENGQYEMWYTGCATTQLLHRIGFATSLDGINWTKHQNPVLEPGTATWESGAVAYPHIIPHSSGYKMWYTGGSAGWSQTAIGYATSPDGINWERFTGNPVLVSGAAGQWDHIVFGPRVLYIDNFYYMFYTGEINLYQSDKIGLATSSDGLVWTKHPSNPVLQATPGQWDGSRVILGSVLMEDDTLKMYYGGTNGSNFSIGFATSPYSPLPLPPGTFTVGTGGNFETIQEAFDKLGTDGVAGSVTLELIDELYTAPTDSFGFKLNGPIPGAGPNSRVTIEPAENKNVTIEGSGGATLSFLKTRYLTIDGVELSGPTTLTIRSLVESQFTWVNSAVFYPPAAHNIVENVIFNNENYLKGVGLAFMSFVSTTSPLDSNLIQNNFVKKATIGIYVSGWSGIAEARYNIVSGNLIGSEIDSLITWGIQIEGNDNSIIENNRVENIKQQFALNITTHGINIVGGNSCTIRGNVVHKVRSHLQYGSSGILLSGDVGTFGFGSDNLVYNNMIYDIQSTSVNANSRIAGIQLWYQNNPKIYYNTIHLSGTGGSSPGGSAALFMVSSVPNLDVKNNIFVNKRNDSPYCASSICDYSSSTFTSDYNDLFYDNTNPNNCLVKIGSTNYLTLADWQAAGKDINSINEMPNFKAPYLHIEETIGTLLEGGATPIAGINTDFDGETRHASTPDIGADEFSGFTPVELISFSASVNVKEVVLNWSTATETNNQGFEILRFAQNDNEWETIGFVPGFGTTTEPRSYCFTDTKVSTGKYTYRLKQIDFDGSFEYSQEVEVEVTAPFEYALEQNYPNPFNPSTKIKYSVPQTSQVQIKVFDVLGNEIEALVSEERPAGTYELTWNAANLPSGVYFYQLKATPILPGGKQDGGQAGEFISTKKMILMR